MKKDVCNILQIALLSQIGKKLENLRLTSEEDNGDGESDEEVKTIELNTSYRVDTEWGNNEYIKDWSPNSIMFYTKRNEEEYRILYMDEDGNFYSCEEHSENIVLGDIYTYSYGGDIKICSVVNGNLLRYKYTLDTDEEMISVSYLGTTKIENVIIHHFIFLTNKRLSCLDMNTPTGETIEHPISLTEFDSNKIQLLSSSLLIIGGDLYELESNYTVEKLPTNSYVNSLLSSTDIRIIEASKNYAIYEYTDKDTWGFYSNGFSKEIQNSKFININPFDYYITSTSGFYKIDNGTRTISKYEFTHKGTKLDSKDFVMWLDEYQILDKHGMIYTNILL